jgi:hypothetical protein
MPGLTLLIPLLLAQDIEEVSFELKANVILVTGSINGRPGHIFIFDTGAEKCCITPRAAAACGVTPGAGGLATPDIALGRAEAKGVEAAVMDPPQAQPLRTAYGVDYSGIIGFPYISRFVATFDYKNHKLHLAPVDKTPKLAAVGAADRLVAFKLVRSLILFEDVKVNGRGGHTFLFDSGASESIVLPDAARAIGLKGEPTQSSAGPIEKTTLETLEVGGARLEKLGVAIYDPPQARPLRAANGGKLDGLLGHSFFEKFLVTVDYRSREVLFTPHGAARGRRAPAAPAAGLTLAEAEGGVRVEAVEPGSAADKAGLEAGDVIEKAKGKPVARPEDLLALIKPGATLPLTVLRDGRKKSIRLRC